MIGGYFYKEKDSAIDARVRTLASGFSHPDTFADGYFFYTNPFQSEVKPYACAGESIALSEDLLVVKDESGPYRLARLDAGSWPISNGMDPMLSIQFKAIFGWRWRAARLPAGACILLPIAQARDGSTIQH